MNLSDPSLSDPLRAWRDEHLRFDGVGYKFADGADFENVRHAIQAAWLAQNYFLALDLSCRYGMEDVLCLRCVQRRVRSAETTFVQPRDWIPVVAWHALCEHCCLDLMGVK